MYRSILVYLILWLSCSSSAPLKKVQKPAKKRQDIIKSIEILEPSVETETLLKEETLLTDKLPIAGPPEVEDVQVDDVEVLNEEIPENIAVAPSSAPVEEQIEVAGEDTEPEELIAETAELEKISPQIQPVFLKRPIPLQFSKISSQAPRLNRINPKIALAQRLSNGRPHGKLALPISANHLFESSTDSGSINPQLLGIKGEFENLRPGNFQKINPIGIKLSNKILAGKESRILPSSISLSPGQEPEGIQNYFPSELGIDTQALGSDIEEEIMSPEELEYPDLNEENIPELEGHELEAITVPVLIGQDPDLAISGLHDFSNQIDHPYAVGGLEAVVGVAEDPAVPIFERIPSIVGNGLPNHVGEIPHQVGLIPVSGSNKIHDNFYPSQGEGHVLSTGTQGEKPIADFPVQAKPKLPEGVATTSLSTEPNVICEISSDTTSERSKLSPCKPRPAHFTPKNRAKIVKRI